MMRKDPRVYLAHILECVERIEGFTAAGQEAYADQLLIQHAVLYNLQVMGEAAKRVPQDYRAAHPEIPWRQMAGLRDVLIHDYEGVHGAQVWMIVEKNLPQLKRALLDVLPPLDQLEAELAGDAPE